MERIIKLGLAAAGAAALVAAPLPAVANENTDTDTGTVTVTFFEDRYPDGLFDPTQTSPNGNYRERKRDDLPLNLIDVNGDRHYMSADADGDFVFENVPVGPAQVHFPDPNSYRSAAFFDATGAATASDIERLPDGSYMGSPSGVLTVDVDADGEFRLVGMTALRLAADVRFADGSPAAGVGVELGSDEWFSATEYSFRAGSYEATGVRHLPGDLGVRIAAPEGYRVADVVAGNSRGDADFEVTERDGAWWFSSTEVADYFWNPTFTVTLEQLPDTTRPEVTLVSPTTAGPFSSLDVQVDATDDRGLQLIVANIYRNKKLVESTQTRLDGATSGTHTATVELPEGDYTVKYNAHDAAGNVSRTSTAEFTIDTTAPRVTIKNGKRFTVADGDAYELISFKLFDKGEIAMVEINGVEKDLTDNKWSDVNFVEPGTFGGRTGENTIVVYDVAGNTTTIDFTLI